MGYQYRITPQMARQLQDIERIKTEIHAAKISAAAVSALRLRARIRSTHFSTRIEGNRLDLPEVERAILENESAGRNQDKHEVQRYYQALEKVEEWTESRTAITEENIRRLHAIIFAGKRARPTVYRDGQNAVRDSVTGSIVYLPPEAQDVPGLMRELITWIRTAETNVPVPLTAGIVHYQLVTIHPWYDGNGRTARTLATWILYRGGYDLNRMYSLEEEYARDLEGYYAALQTSPHHNYYEGRNSSDITSWLEYFLATMKETFARLAMDLRTHSQPLPGSDSFFRKLDRRGRMVVGLLMGKETIQTTEVACLLGLSDRQTRDLLAGWVKDGWLEAADASRKARRYRIAKKYRRFIGGLSAE